LLDVLAAKVVPHQVQGNQQASAASWDGDEEGPAVHFQE
jgi:hypothetical protein